MATGVAAGSLWFVPADFCFPVANTGGGGRPSHLRSRSVEQTLGQHQHDNAITYLGVRELLRDDRSREEEELDLIPMHL